MRDNENTKAILESAPKFASHKVVRALKVEGFVRRTRDPDGNVTDLDINAIGGDGMRLELSIEGEMATRIFKAFADQEGAWSSRCGYIVLYEDGYISWSPTKAFEEGYSLAEEDESREDEVEDLICDPALLHRYSQAQKALTEAGLDPVALLVDRGEFLYPSGEMPLAFGPKEREWTFGNPMAPRNRHREIFEELFDVRGNRFNPKPFPWEILRPAKPKPNSVDNDQWAHRSSKMKCKTCMWFVGKGDGPTGRCRRRAPTMNGYPVVFEDDFCGDHKLDENKA